MNQRYEADGFECVIVYGRRRAGKNSLIRRFCEGKLTIYFSALLEETAKENLKTLSRAIGEYKVHTGLMNVATLKQYIEILTEETNEN